MESVINAATRPLHKEIELQQAEKEALQEELQVLQTKFGAKVTRILQLEDSLKTEQGDNYIICDF